MAKMIQVESSMIHAAGYDAETRTLEVLFNSGKTYGYEDVPPKVFKGLMAADSKGRYMLSQIIDVYPDYSISGRRQVGKAPKKSMTKKKISRNKGAVTQKDRWSTLWQEWSEIIEEVAQEEGDYIAQEAHWEPPYFNETAFADDLEKIARKMRPLLSTALQNEYAPTTGFSQALLKAEDAISAGLPEWLEIDNGIEMGKNLTVCLLEWEWLKNVATGKDAFAFARRIRDWEDRCSYTYLETDACADFFTELSEEDQQIVFKGLNKHKDKPLWQEPLENIHSHWHSLYMYWLDQYAPEQFLDNLRTTISQQWENGLPVIEDLLSKKDYKGSLAVIKETLDAMLKGHRVGQSWAPHTSLLFVHVSGFYVQKGYLSNHKALLRLYLKIAKGLGDDQLVNTLKIQHSAFNHFFDWQHMFKSFDELVLPKPIHRALFQSWRDHTIQRAGSTSWGFGWGQTDSGWWLHWLIDSIADPKKGPAYFQQQIDHWLKTLANIELTSTKGEFGFLRLLTNDVREMSGRKNSYPIFNEVVINPGRLSTPDVASRQAYLKRFTSGGLLKKIMAYWKEHLHECVPNPKIVANANYAEHARWMAALKELTPSSYKSLLAHWRVEHERRKNLWKIMEERGLA